VTAGAGGGGAEVVAGAGWDEEAGGAEVGVEVQAVRRIPRVKTRIAENSRSFFIKLPSL
jgi:hypothetical protein